MSIGIQQQLQRYAQPLRRVSETNDLESPFSFKVWSDSFQGIIPGQEFTQYNQYLLNWYKKSTAQSTDAKTQLKLNYLTLLKQLQLFFSNTEIETWYNKINLENEKELLLAIPYFAKKLKDIALYYLQLRDNIKKSKTKYSLVGSEGGIVSQIQEFLLTNYTQKPNTTISIPANFWRTVPELSTIKNSINIQIENLYDFFEYLDHSPTEPVTTYYDVTSSNLEKYFNSLGLALTSTDWIFKTGVFDLSGVENISESLVDSVNTAQNILTKYLASNNFTSVLTSGYLVSDIDTYNINIKEGNNFFYWPFGAYSSFIDTLPRYQTVSLSSTDFNTFGTAGSSIETSDTIFVKTVNGVQGAWLRLKSQDESSATMKATLKRGETTKFRYPFPGFGISGQDISWTGYSLVSEPQYFYLSDLTKQAIDNVYWSSSIPLTTHNIIDINSTELVANKAYASLNYEGADKIRQWPTPPSYSSSTYSGLYKEAWLYKMTQTDISIAPNKNTTIVWPYLSLSPQEDFPTIPEFVDTSCLPVTLSSIEFKFATASNHLTGADKIYKIANYQDTIDLATECAWLSGKTVYYPDTKITAVLQPSLNCIFKPGTFTKFIWQGENNTDCNAVFRTFDHQDDCEYKLTNANYKDFATCNCKLTLFAPFGHPGNSFFDNAGYSDYIVEDFIDGNDSVDLTNLTDSQGNAITQTSQFAWFKTNNKIGWGNGSWLDGTGSSGVKLQTGKSYIYYRQKFKTGNSTTQSQFPEYCIRYYYNNFNNNNFTWIQATKDQITKEWVPTDNKTNFVIYPGELLLYTKQPTSSFYTSVSTTQEIITNENRGSIWTDYDYLTIGENSLQPSIPQQFILSYPSANTNQTAGTGQYPLLNIYNGFLSVLQWSVSAPNGAVTVYRNTPTLTITPTLSGLYTFSVTAVSATSTPPRINVSTTNGTWFYTNTSTFIFNNIPPVTAISNIITTYPTTAVETPVPGYILNTPLYGWDYNISNYTGQSTGFGNFGARPFWAESSTEKNQYTNFKGIEAWGNYNRLVDDYNWLSQPNIATISLSTGNYISYTRQNISDIIWEQPLKQKVSNSQKIWSTINIITTSTSNLQTSIKDLVTLPSTNTSPILLNSLIDNNPVEVYYNALSPFTVTITATPSVPVTVYSELSTLNNISPTQPWANLPNRYYPNVAILPTVQNLSSISNFGGYFIPTNLGASQYINKDYTVLTALTSTALSSIFEDPKKYIAGRGLTKQDQQTPYQIEVENNIWLKEPLVSGPIAGTIKKDVFKKYQKFIPYQSLYETNSRTRYGLITPASRQTPWSGKNDTTWNDFQNYPVSFTGELNVENWSDSQILKRFGLQLDCWTTDIFGNQYGLYKNIANITPANRNNVPGGIWVRKNSQITSPGYIALSGIFDTYKNTFIYSDLANDGVNKIDVFFDTLYLQTTAAIFFEKIIYDFDTDEIYSIADESRFINLQLPVGTNFNIPLSSLGNNANSNFAIAGETWFFPESKLVIQSVASLSGNQLSFELYEYNLNSLTLQKIFPSLSNDIVLINSLSSLNFSVIESPKITYNPLKKQYVFALLGKSTNNVDIIVELIVNNYPVLELEDIIVYSSQVNNNLTSPPVVQQSLYITLSNTSTVNVQICANFTPVIFEPLNIPAWANLTNTGLFTGTVPTTGVYYLPFKVSNSIGSTFYTLTLNKK